MADLERTGGAAARGRARGTFGAVFAPIVLAAVSIVLYRRLGVVVGGAGLARALAMLALAGAIALLTSFSLAAAATSRGTCGDRDRFILARTLGVEFGGALGAAVYLALAALVACLCIGFAEGAAALFGGSALAVRLTAIGAGFALFQLAYLGARLAAGAHAVVLAGLGGALAALFAGGRAAWDSSVLQQSWSAGDAALPFWPIFALFFPAASGLALAIAALGDVRDARRSLTLGAFPALGLSGALYAAALFVLAGSAPLASLAADHDAVPRLAALPWLLHAGVLSAALAAALAALRGAARVLQALAADRLFAPLAFFEAGRGPADNPRRAVVLTGLAVLVMIALGDLDAAATLASMFLLLSYGLLNYATCVAAAGDSPPLRPRLRFFHPRASLAGAGLCAFAMLMLDPLASLAAIGTVALVHQYLHWTAVPARWRDNLRAYRFQRVKKGLREIAGQPERPADWQPHVLAFVETSAHVERVLRVADWLSGGSGLVSAVRLLAGDPARPAVRQACRDAERRLAADVQRYGLDVHPLVVAAGEASEGASTLLQAWGAGPIRANTILLSRGDSGDPQDEAALAPRYAALLQRAAALGRHAVVLHAEEAAWSALKQTAAGGRRIDVWWLDDDSSRLALLFARLLTRSDEWRDAAVRLLAPAPAATAGQVEANLRARPGASDRDAGIDADIVPVDAAEGDRMFARSRDAALVLLPLRLEGEGMLRAAGGPADRLLAALPVVAAVAAAGDVAPEDEPPADAGDRQ